MTKTLTVTIEVQAAGKEIQIPVYATEVESSGDREMGGSWEETFATLGELNAYITGLKTACAFSKDVSVIGLPSGFNDFHIRNRLHEAPFQLWPIPKGESGT